MKHESFLSEGNYINISIMSAFHLFSTFNFVLCLYTPIIYSLCDSSTAKMFQLLSKNFSSSYIRVCAKTQINTQYSLILPYEKIYNFTTNYRGMKLGIWNMYFQSSLKKGNRKYSFKQFISNVQQTKYINQHCECI